MLFRFCLYGFLKNQRYFEPFLILVFLEKDLSFFLIGLLIAFREAVVNLLEIPSGGIADVCGRRKSMMLSFAAYIASFLVFGLAGHLGLLFAAMFLFAIGEAFRTGTHKAMIFTWLRLQGRENERTQVWLYALLEQVRLGALGRPGRALCIRRRQLHLHLLLLNCALRAEHRQLHGISSGTRGRAGGQGGVGRSRAASAAGVQDRVHPRRAAPCAG